MTIDQVISFHRAVNHVLFRTRHAEGLEPLAEAAFVVPDTLRFAKMQDVMWRPGCLLVKPSANDASFPPLSTLSTTPRSTPPAA